MKKLLYLVIIGLVVTVGIGVFFFVQKEQHRIKSFEQCAASGFPIQESYPRACKADDQTFTEDIGNELEKIDLIRLAHPRPNQEILSPVDIQGSARGNWFFEATFPVKILGENGEILLESYVQADGEWMSEDFVPFSRRVEFDKKGNLRGTIVLQKSNPSGLPEHDDFLRVPVKFK